MEILVKITDVKTDPNETSATTANKAIAEAAKVLIDDETRINTLLSKGRKKIDLVGFTCNLEISLKD